MTLKLLPVLPPEIRPILKLQDNIIISSDLNYFYSKIINNNNRIEQLKLMNLDEKFLNKEKVTIQEYTDSLINKSINKMRLKEL